jgi:hypothetical protein
MTTKSTGAEAIAAVPFQVDSIEPAAPPEGSEGSWFRYVITQQGTNKITGVRAGTRDEVGTRLDDMVACLNDRRLGKHRPKSKSTGTFSRRG